MPIPGTLRAPFTGSTFFLISAVQQSDSVIFSLFHILLHSGLSQDIKYSSLFCTVGSCLSVLYAS